MKNNKKYNAPESNESININDEDYFGESQPLFKEDRLEASEELFVEDSLMVEGSGVAEKAKTKKSDKPEERNFLKDEKFELDFLNEDNEKPVKKSRNETAKTKAQEALSANIKKEKQKNAEKNKNFFNDIEIEEIDEIKKIENQAKLSQPTADDEVPFEIESRNDFEKQLEKEKQKAKKNKEGFNSEKETNKVVYYLKKWWYIFAIVIVLIAVSVPTSILIVNRNKIFISNAEDLINPKKGNIYVLNRDIAIDGDITLQEVYSIDLNGHKLSINGNLTLASPTANQVNIGTKKGKNFINKGTVFVKGSFNINTPQANITVNSNTNIGAGLNVVAKGFVVNAPLRTEDNVKIDANNVEVNAEIVAGESRIVTVSGDTLSIVQNIGCKALYVNNAKMFVDIFTSVKTIILNEYAELDLYGVTTTIEGGNLVHFRETAKCASLTGTLTLKSYNYAMPEIVDGKIDVINIINLKPTREVKVVKLNGLVYCVIASVVNADRYIINFDNGQSLTYNVEGNNPFIYVEITKQLTNLAGKHKISVTTASSNANYIPSDAINIEYNHILTLNPPMGLKVEIVEGKIILSCNRVEMAEFYVVSINGEEINPFNAQDKQLQTFEITSHITSAGEYVIKVLCVSKNESVSPSEYTLITYHNKVELAKTTIEAVGYSGGNYNISWAGVENAKSYLIYANNVLQARTSKNSITLTGLEQGAEVKIVCEGYGYYLSSAETVVELAVKINGDAGKR